MGFAEVHDCDVRVQRLGIFIDLSPEVSENVGASHFESEGVSDKDEQVDAEEGEHGKSDVPNSLERLERQHDEQWCDY